jgi:oligoendopeptidase F
MSAKTAIHDSSSKEWNLGDIYPTETDWSNAVADINNSILDMDKRAKNIDTALALAELLDAVYSLRSRAGKLAKVGLLEHFTDTTNEQFKRKMEQSEFLESQVESAVAFVGSIIRRIPKEQLIKWQKQTPQLARHKRRINRTLRTASFNLTPEAESVIADLTRLPRTANDVYRQLIGSDLNWPIDNKIKLTPNNYNEIRRTKALQDRERSSKAFFNHLGNYQDLFALALMRRIEGDSLIAKHRGLSSSVDTLLVLQDGFEMNGHQQIYEAISQSQKKMAFIVGTLARAKSQPYLTPSDFRSLVNKEKRSYTRDYAHRITLKAAEFISPEYSSLMASRLKLPWMHLSDDENKSNTVGVFWQVGGGDPHTIFKYRDDYISFRLYSSAAFLMMGLADIPDEKAPERREEDLPVFSNALWYLGHFMQTDALLQSNNTSAIKKQVLANLLTRSLNTLVNYAAMVKLEDYISQTLLSGESISPEDINTYYLSTLKTFFAGTDMNIQEYWKRGWINESFAFYGPHYASFYQAISSALTLKNKISQGDKRAIKVIQHGIAYSDTHFSADVLKEAGIDMSSIDTYLNAIDALYKIALQLDALGH